LEDYIVHKRNIYKPKVSEGEYQNYIMLAYYRNALNFVFFNEAMILCSLMSMGTDFAWNAGMDVEELFKRTCYLSELLKREEVLKERITTKNREFFDKTLDFMLKQRIITSSNNKVSLKSSGEAISLMICSVAWPMIDTYYSVLIFSLTLIK
jgi:glycerol-3-phosphate O-acyltransferase